VDLRFARQVVVNPESKATVASVKQDAPLRVPPRVPQRAARRTAQRVAQRVKVARRQR
jgi:hypothetical protein